MIDKKNLKRHYKTCPVCGKSFPSPPSDKTVTCGDKTCRHIHISNTHKGKHNYWSEEAKQRLSEKGQTQNLKLGTEAAKQSPLSGKFPTNINAKDWHIVSPNGVHYRFHSLNYWTRKNCALFGFEQSEKNAQRIASGIKVAKAGALKKQYTRSHAYKGWSVIID